MISGDIETNNQKPRWNDEKKLPWITFVTWTFTLSLLLMLAFFRKASPDSVRAWGFGLATTIEYAALYTMPTLCVILIAAKTRSVGIGWRIFSDVSIVVVATIVQLYLAADYFIHEMFGFHINGFVINLITTPEGLASTGADEGVKYVCLIVIAAVLLANGGMWWATAYRQMGLRFHRAVAGRRILWVFAGLFIISIGERVTYGISHLQARPDVMVMAAAIPGYQPMTMRSLGKKLGIEMKRRASVSSPKSDAALAYPTKPLVQSVPKKRMNVVWLVCESLRADMLTPEIMPKTWEFAKSGQRFTQHYSGGNGTRMGLFTLFYGMPGNYWFQFLGNRRPPLLMDRLQDLNYAMRISTSAAFSYPEFDKTIFSHIPAENLHALKKDQGWMSDRHHVGKMKEWLAQDQGDAPFFLFHFFESPHARYYFPPESVIRTPYLEEFNYATVDLKRDIPLVRNRYINAVHHLDSQIGEVIDALKDRNVLDDTWVMITGDHGEEFMECGRWGHNSAFTEPQIRVPMVLHVPGMAAGVMDHRTSHVDLVPSILPLLGVTNQTQDYSTGENLFSAAPRILTFADWDRIAISDGTHKATFPLSVSDQIQSVVTTVDDQPIKDQSAALRKLGGPMSELMNMMRQFTRKKP